MRKFRSNLFFGGSLIVLFLYLLSLSGWYFNATAFSFGAVFSIAFAYLWPAIFILSVLWWFKSKRFSVVFLLLLLMGLPPAASTFSLGIPKAFTKKKESKALRVMHWNCGNMPIDGQWSKKNMRQRRRVKSFFDQYKPDVLCLQDFTEIEGPLFFSNLKFIRDTLGLPYIHVVFKAYGIYNYGKVKMGNLIASKIPFNGFGQYTYSQPEYPNPVLWVDLTWQSKPIRILATHLQSMNLFSHNDLNPDNLPYYFQSDSAIIMNPDILFKLKHFQKVHAEQAKELTAILDSSSIPIILTADLNSVPAGNVYQILKGKRFQDGFLGTKTGLGNTFNFLLPNLRIDYLWHDTALRCTQWHHFQDGFFDHDHLIGDFYHP